MKKKRFGEEEYNNKGYKMKIIEYNKCDSIIVEFQDEYKVKVSTTYQNFKKGNVKNPYFPSVFGVGYIGQGKYSYKKYKKIYGMWHNMLMRCYDAYYINKYLTYIDCYVCEEWLNFQNFAEWYERKYYEVEGQRMELDKDILCKGNKIYSPDTCIFVPQRINYLFVKADVIRGKYPIGCSYNSEKNKLCVKCRIYEDKKKRKKYLGSFPLDKPFQAFTTYKKFKEKYIKQVADEYKGLIPEKLYNAMYNYEVEIND